ncbi:MAG: HNH endonuclease signature motif containing protein [Cyanobacteria bacterium J06621_11]
MARRYVTVAEKRQIIERADRRCEYCQSRLDYSPQSFDIEHVLPVVLGGKTTIDNLASACGGCNSCKYTKTEALDPVDQTVVPLYHPRQHLWSDRFSWSADCSKVIGRIVIGRASVVSLQLYSKGFTNLRRLLLLCGLHPSDR